MSLKSMLLGSCALVVGTSVSLGADLYLPEVPVVEVGDTYAVELGVAAGWTLRTDTEEEELGDTEDDSYGIVEFTARFGVPVADSVYLQLDLDAERAAPEMDGNSYIGSLIGGAHLAYRDDSFLLGSFAALGALEDNEDEGGTLWSVGVEGQAYVDTTTLYGQIGYLDSSGLDDEDQEGMSDTWFARGVVSHFLADGNTKLQAELSGGTGLQDAGAGDPDETSFVGWGAEIEHAISEGVSVFASYEGVAWFEASDNDVTQSIADHVVKVGLRWTMDDTTLLEKNRSGTALSLPNLGHWATGVTAVD